MRNRYSAQEENTVVSVYQHTPGESRTNRAIIASALHPTNTHSLASWAAMFGRLEKLDKRNTKATRFVVSQSLTAAAEKAAPELFA